MLPESRATRKLSRPVQFDEKRPSRAVEELRQVAATRTERRLYVRVTSPTQTSSPHRPESLLAQLFRSRLRLSSQMTKGSLASLSDFHAHASVPVSFAGDAAH